MPILKSHLYSLYKLLRYKGTMMDGIISRVYLQMCDPLFSSCKEIQNYRSFFENAISERFSEGFVEGKGDREKRLFALGFAGSKGRNQGRTSSIHLHHLLMASGMEIMFYVFNYVFNSWDDIDSWFMAVNPHNSCFYF